MQSHRRGIAWGVATGRGFRTSHPDAQFMNQLTRAEIKLVEDITTTQLRSVSAGTLEHPYPEGYPLERFSRAQWTAELTRDRECAPNRQEGENDE